MKKFVVILALFVMLSVTVFVINQTAQVVMLANTISPVFGRIVLLSLLLCYGVIVVTPIVMILRLPQALADPPADENSPEYATYLQQLGQRLKTNSRLRNSTGALADRPSIESALSILDEDANAIIKRTASSLFVSTAISQNGRLDTFMVLAAQTRMIWQLAHVYNQRPALSEMTKLYAHVGTAVFLASELEDLDISHQVEPVVKAAIGSSLAGMVPGISSVATIVTHSILSGTANAYLTLRVGVITQTYSKSVTAVDQKRVRRKASLVAASLLGSIVSDSATKVVKVILSAAKDTGSSAVQSATSGMRQMGAQVGAHVEKLLNPFTPRD